MVETAPAAPLAAIEVPRGPVTALLLVALCAAAVLAARRVRLPRIAAPHVSFTRRRSPSRRALAIALAPVLAVAAIGIGLLATAAPSFRVRALDIGQGDAYLVEVAGRVALIDGGPDPNRLLAAPGARLPASPRHTHLPVLTHA